MLNIEKTLIAFRQLRVMIIGDLMLDQYYYGKVDRISPEAPVPVVTIAEKEVRLGGAANVALNIKTLGAEPVLVGIVGADLPGEELCQLLKEQHISDASVFKSKKRKTTVKTRVLSLGKQLIRLDEEDTYWLLPMEFQSILPDILRKIENKEIDVILFQDYNKGLLSQNLIERVLEVAGKLKIPVAVDPKKDNFLTYKKVNLFKPNLREINENLPFTTSPNLKELKKAARYLREKIDNKLTLITLSERGVYYSDGHQGAILPTEPRNIADVCGAGDSVFSVAALAMAAHVPINDIAVLSNLAGGQVCERVGVVPVSPRKLIDDYNALIKNSD